ncbi:MAG: glycosyltransferase [Candidatus Aminicenantaceae bacterium]
MPEVKHPDFEISVIIPTYNRSGFLLEAIRSVLDQDYWAGRGAWEFVVVDDGSTDDTAETVRPFEDRVAYVMQPHSGVSAARNLGLRLTRGKFVAFLDSDDLWEPGKITRQMRFMEEQPEAVVVCSEETWIRNGVFVNPRRKHRKYSGWVFDKFLPLCLLSLSSALFRRRVFEEIGAFDEDLPACEDYDLGIRLASRYPVYTLPEALIVKRGGHADQLSRKYWGMDRFRVAALEKALALDLTPEQRRLVKEELTQKCRILINGFHKRGKIADAEPYEDLLRCYDADPGSKPSNSQPRDGDG